jgi:NitT/TauT family transport system substrate-binding protein
MRRILHLSSRQVCGRLVVVLFIVLLSACSRQVSTPSAQTGVTPPADLEAASVSVQLGWIHSYSTAYFYTAEKNNHYAAQKLSVELVEGGFNESGYIDAIDEVADGKADFGLANAYSVIEARAQGKPLVAVAAIFQRNPAAILSLKTSNIVRPKDLIGRSVVINSSTNSLEKMLKLHDLDPSTLKSVQRKGYDVAQLINGEADAMLAWVINEGVMLEEAGVEYNTMLLSDYGIYEYETVLFTTEELIENKPDLVKRFVTATLAGIQDVIDNPSQAVSYVIEYGDGLDYQSEYRRVHALLPILKQPNVELGYIDYDIWMQTVDKLRVQGVDVSSKVAVTSYTNQFLDADNSSY